MPVQPYLFFDGRCEEAVDFYRRALGAEILMLMRFKDSPDPAMVEPGSEAKVMHMAFRVGDTTLLASDGRCLGRPSFEGFALSLTAPDDARAERLFAALADGGQVQMPLSKTFFSSSFGMVADRFGVSWMIYVAPGSEALARRFEVKAQDALATLERLGDADWRKVTAAEKWPVGVTAHHLAGALERVCALVKAMAQLIDAIQALQRENKETLWGSMVKQTMIRKNPAFNESYYGYSTFSKLLEEAAKQKIVSLERDEKSGTYIITALSEEGGRAA